MPEGIQIKSNREEIVEQRRMLSDESIELHKEQMALEQKQVRYRERVQQLHHTCHRHYGGHEMVSMGRQPYGETWYSCRHCGYESMRK